MTGGIRLRDDLALMSGYHSAQVDAKVRLNTNESPYPPPAAWLDALSEELRRIAFNRYPDRAAWRLRTAIGELHGVGPEQVLATKGSNEALQAVCLAYGGHGRRAAVFEPTYALHAHIARLAGTDVVIGERDENFRLDVGEVRRVMDEAAPQITFVCSPNNPTGGAESEETVTEVLRLAPGLVVVDEAYAQFASWSALALVAEDQAVVVTRTYSKTWSMAGARLGYLVASPELVAGCEQVLLPYHLDSVTQAAGFLALCFQGEMDQRVQRLVAERKRLISEMAALDIQTWASDANFVLFRARTEGSASSVDSAAATDAGRALWQALVDRSVLVRDCSSWPRLSGCLRVTVGTPDENDAFLVALAEALPSMESDELVVRGLRRRIS